MKSTTLHLQSWSRVALTTPIVAGEQFLARLGTFSSPVTGAPIQSVAATAETFELNAHRHNQYAETPEGGVLKTVGTSLHLGRSAMPPGNEGYEMFKYAVPLDMVNCFNTALRLNTATDAMQAPAGRSL